MRLYRAGTAIKTVGFVSAQSVVKLRASPASATSLPMASMPCSSTVWP